MKERESESRRAGREKGNKERKKERKKLGRKEGREKKNAKKKKKKKKKREREKRKVKSGKWKEGRGKTEEVLDLRYARQAFRDGAFRRSLARRLARRCQYTRPDARGCVRLSEA